MDKIQGISTPEDLNKALEYLAFCNRCTFPADFEKKFYAYMESLGKYSHTFILLTRDSVRRTLERKGLVESYQEWQGGDNDICMAIAYSYFTSTTSGI
jgi:hypothetical protein